MYRFGLLESAWDGVGGNASAFGLAGSTDGDPDAVRSDLATRDAATLPLPIWSPLVFANGGDDYGDDTSTTGVISVGGSATGTFETYRDVDWFRLDIADAGTNLALISELRLQETDLAIYDANGELVRDPFDNATTVTFDAAGTYYVSVRAGSYGGYGRYTLTTNLVATDDHFSSVSTAGTVSVGGMVSGTHESEVDDDWFRIDITDPGTTLRFDLTGAEGRQQVIHILDANGDYIEFGGFNSGISDSFGGMTFADAGTYYISVSANGSMGDYAFTATIDADDIGNTTDTTGVLVAGGSVTSTSSFRYDDDWFRLDVNDANATLAFTASGDAPGLIIFYDAEGDYLAYGGYNSASYTFVDAGTYFVRFAGRGEGEYTLSSEFLTDDFANSAGGAAAIATDGTSLTLNADYTGDTDWIAVTVAAGETVRFDLDTSIEYGINSIYNSDGQFDGQIVFYTGDGGYNFTEAGTYYLALESYTDITAPVSVSVTASVVTGDVLAGPHSTATFEIGDTIASTFDFGQDEDWFTFTAEAGEIVRFSDAGLNGEISVLDADGIGLALFDGVHTFETSGTYTLVALGYGTGDYTIRTEIVEDDYAGNSTTTGVIEEGTPAMGQVDFLDDQDWFAITITDPLVALFFEADIVEGIGARVVDAEGNALGDYFRQNLSGVSVGDAELSAGTYYVAIDGNFEVGEDYSVWIKDIVADDHFGDERTTSALVADGTPVSGTTNYLGDQDAFYITVETGDTIQFEVTNGLSLSIDGVGGRGSEYLATFESGGTYLVRVRNNNTDPVGMEYALSAERISGDDYTDDASTTGVVPLGGGATGRIDFAGDVDWLALEIPADGATFTLTGESATNTYFSVVTADGGHVASGDYSVAGRFVYELAAGTYYVQVESLSETDDYTITTTDYTDDHFGGAALADTVLVVNDATGVSGIYDYVDDRDAFQVTVEAGDVVRFSVTGDLGVGVYGFGSGNNDYTVSFVDAGTYTVFVGQSFSANVGTAYTLTAERIEDDYADNSSTTGVLEVGGTASGNTDFDGDVDWFALDIDQAGLVRLTVESGNNDLIDIYDGTGAFIGSVDTFSNAFDFQAGQYFVSYTQFGTGSYTLSAETVVDDYAGDTTTTGAISPGTSVTGRIDFGDDDDWFAFTVAQDDITAFSVVDGFVELSIYDAQGQFVEFLFDGGSVQLDAGDYFLSATSFETTDYTISMDTIVDDYGDTAETAGSVEVGGSADGQISFNGDVDWFALEATAGQIYELSLDLFEPEAFLSVETADGSALDGTVFYDIFSGSTFFRAFSDFTAYVAVTGELLPGESVKDYTLFVGTVSDPDGDDIETATEIRVGDTIVADIYSEGDRDVFAFSVEDGGTYAFDGQQDFIPGLYYEAYSSDGTLLGWGDDATTLDFTSDYTGTAYLYVTALEAMDYTILTAQTGPGIRGTSGDDTLLGTQGDDEIYGGRGDDLLQGMSGADLLDGGEGTDMVSYADATEGMVIDLARNRASDGDTFVSIESVTATEFADRVFLTREAGVVFGLGGNDTIFGFDGDDELHGGDGLDRLFGRDGDDVLYGGDGFDTLIGGAGNDTLYGEGDRGRLYGGDGEDTIHGGDVADLMAGQDGNDTLFGNGGNDRLLGGNGDDVLEAGAGRDRLDGEAGNDIMRGGDGYDTLYGGAGQDELHGDAQADTLYGGLDDDQLWGGSGNDLLYGQGGNDLINGGDGADQMFGGVGEDVMAGGAGNDRMLGQDGNDIISGGAGDDTLQGDGGDDVLIADGGSDTMRGGAGADTFVVGAASATETTTVFDFTDGEDTIDLTALEIGTDLASSGLTLTQVGVNVVIDLGVGLGQITLVRTDLADLDDADFAF